MAIADQESPQSRNQLIQNVYSLICSNSGKIRTIDLDRIVGNKQDVRFAITRLTIMGRIRRKRGLGSNGIEYYYHDIHSETFSKIRKRALLTQSRSGQP